MFSAYDSPLPTLICHAVSCQDQQVTISLTSTATQAHCPLCGLASERIHSRYIRRLTAFPLEGIACRWHIQACKFFCDNPDCQRCIFTQRFSQQIKPYGRWLDQCQQLLQQIGLNMGGRLGSGMARLFGLVVSGTTLLRRVRQQATGVITAPRVLGVDDWAFRKGKTYGTILVDMERQCVIDLLPDRETQTLKKWLDDHPGVEIVSRDRASTYTLAVTQALPHAIQVADRWHLLKNLGEAIQRVLEANRGVLKQAAQDLAQEQLPLKTLPDTVVSPTNQTASTSHREQLYQQVKGYQAAGHSVRWVAKQTGLARNTVRKYWRWSVFQAKTRSRCTPIYQYKAHLRQRWQEGQQHLDTLHAEVRRQGFAGSRSAVYRLVSQWPRDEKAIPAEPLVRPIDYAPRQVSIWLSKPLEELPNDSIRAYLTKLIASSPLLADVRQQAMAFKRMMADKAVEKLDEWLKTSELSEAESMRQFVRGLRQDYAAVRQAFSSKWSNGQVEGQVNRLKTIKRQMYGRAGFELLKRRVVARSR